MTAVPTLDALVRRLSKSAVVWSWVFNGLRLASGFILLPLVLNKLPTAELGMYYVLISLTALVQLVDFGFGPTIGRFVSYAMGGAETIQAHGVPEPGKSKVPNFTLLWDLLITTRALYRYLTVVLFFVMGAWGTYVVELRIQETSSPLLTRVAWGATLVSALFDIYSNWWVTYVRSMNEVTVAARIAVLSQAVRILVAAVLLACGVGLLSMPIGSFFGSVLQREFARRRCRQLFAGHSKPPAIDTKKYLRILWPNTWRLGLQLVSGYLTVNANMAVCLYVLGLSGNAQYGLSVQLVGFITAMAGVWIAVKWPLIGQCRARHDFQQVQKILWPRVWLQNLTFLAASAGLLVCGPILLKWFGGGKQLLPFAWLALMLLNALFEMQFNIWGTLLFTENRLPYLWPSVATNVLSLLFSVLLIHYTDLGLGALVLGPLLAGALFNYWFWPPFAARSIGTTLFRFMFSRPRENRAEVEAGYASPRV